MRYLPADSALGRRGLAGESKPSLQERLGAEQINTLRLANFYFLSANSGKNSKPPEPKFIEFPDD